MLYYILYIDSIEANVDNAAVHVEDANVQLQKASHYQVLQSHHKFVVVIGCSHIFKNKCYLILWSVCFHSCGQQVFIFNGQNNVFTKIKSSTPTGLVWTATWLSFLCSGTLIWLPWHHVKTHFAQTCRQVNVTLQW